MTTVKDPIGNEIYVPEWVSHFNDQTLHSTERLDDPNDVIEKPAMIFIINNDTGELYYMRAIGWHTTMLIGVQKIDSRMEVTFCEVNPPVQMFNELCEIAELII